jgi:hypothetical protein
MTGATPLYNQPLGIQGACYLGAAGTTPTALLNDDQKVTISIDNKVVEWHTRGNPVDTSDVASQTVTASLSVVKNNKNAQFILLQTCSQQRTPIAAKFLDRITGSTFTGYGVDGDWTIKSYKENQDEQGVDMVDIELSLCQLYRAATWSNGTGS